MTIEPRRPSDTGSGFLARRRRTVIASALALGVAGALGGQALTSYVAPAHADTASAIQPQAGPALPSFAEVVDRVKPAVVSVRVKNIATDDEASAGGMPGVPGLDQLPNDHPLKKFFREFGQGQGGKPRQHRGMAQGSGFFISSDGYVVTNNHVVQGAKEVELKPDDDTTYKAKVVGTDPRTDLALLKVEGDKKDFPYVKFAKDGPRVGDWVIAVGNPFGLGGSVTAGIVSARGRDIGASAYDDFIQIDAAVNKGNSGGPAFDVEGNVIGVNTAIFSPSGGSVGIAFAIPAETVKSVVAQLKEHGTVTRGWIGVQIQPVTKDIADSLGLKKAHGALVAEPQSGGPAQKAGIRAGDVITAVNGEEVKDARDLAKKIGALQPKQDVKLTVLSGGSEKTVSLTLGSLPNERQAKADDNDSEGAEVGKLGLTLAPAGRVAGAGADGVVVTGVDAAGAAAERGFAVGDVILEVAGKKVETPSDVRQAIAAVRSEGKRTVLMRVKKGENSRFVALPVSNS